MYYIRETDDFYPLSVLHHDSGLEVPIMKETQPETLKMWRCDDEETGKLIAAATLQYKSGCYVLEHLSVDESRRGEGFGKMLLDIAEEEAINRGTDEMWLVGKVPEFYKQYGWEVIERETAPDISNCQKCNEFGVSCFPEVMKKTFER